MYSIIYTLLYMYNNSINTIIYTINNIILYNLSYIVQCYFLLSYVIIYNKNNINIITLLYITIIN